MKTERKCKTCLKVFYVYPSWSGRNYCSRKCYLTKHTSGTKRCKCKICGKIFYTPKNRIDDDKGKFCCRKCADKGKIFIRKGTYRKCKYCKKPIYAMASRIRIGWGKFCNQECFRSWFIDETAKGRISPTKTKHLHGYYISTMTSKREYYQSSYELIRMKQLDNSGERWTKKHGIVIPYMNRNKKQRYIPDFLVNNSIIEEVKPSVLINSVCFNNKEKIKYAKKFCKKNGYSFRIITEKELGIKI
jgi:hypothetical protein